MPEQEKKENGSKKDTGKDKEKSFWQTLPGIITAVSGLIVAITGLVTAIHELKPDEEATPTAFITNTPVDIDATDPAPVVVTHEPTKQTVSAPSCKAFTVYQDKVNPNAVVLAYSDEDMWVQYGAIDDSVADQAGVIAYLFDTSENAANCLRNWVKYLLVDHTPHWPTAASGTGRTYEEVWLSSLTPPIIGELAYWPAVPDTILVTTVNQDSSPDSVRIFLCGADIPSEELSRSGYWHAATSEDALQDYLDHYFATGYTPLSTVPCDN
jgi:hypothetical protein